MRPHGPQSPQPGSQVRIIRRFAPNQRFRHEFCCFDSRYRACPDPASGPTILFNITHGFQARMLLRSQIAENLLARGAKLIIVSRATDEPYFRQEFSHPQISLEEMPQRFSRSITLINLRQYFLMNASLGITLNYKNEAFRRERPRRYWIARAVNSVLGRIPPLRRAYLAGEARVFPGGEFDELLKSYRPDLVVTGTPGLNRNDVHLMRAAGGPASRRPRSCSRGTTSPAKGTWAPGPTICSCGAT